MGIVSKTNKAYRKFLYSSYSHLYHRVHEIDQSECYYCGEPREAYDHVPPLHVVDQVSTEKIRELDINLLLLPSCTHCNSLLGSKHLVTIGERLDHLHKKLSDKYEKDSVLWSEEELEEMSYTFQLFIKARSATMSGLLSRIRHIEKKIVEDYENPLSYSMH